MIYLKLFCYCHEIKTNLINIFILYSCEQCKSYIKNTENSHGYSVIYALQTDFTIWVSDFSHLVCKNHDGSNNKVFCESTMHAVVVPKNCFIVMHSGLVHAGGESKNAGL